MLINAIDKQFYYIGTALISQINSVYKSKRYRLSTALCRLHRGSQINPQINAQLRGKTRSAISQQYCRCQTASTTAQNLKRDCSRGRYAVLGSIYYALWAWHEF